MPGDRERRDELSQAEELNARGLALAEKGWLGEAITHFRRATELAPERGDLWDHLASTLADDGRLREALGAYLRAAELEPEVGAARYNLASFLMTYASQLAEAELREAVRLEPGEPDAHLSLGMALADQGKSDEALIAIRTALALAPDDPLAHHELALLLIDDGDGRTGLVHLREVVRLEPDNFEAWIDLASCYADHSLHSECARALDHAEALRPDDPEVALAQASLAARRQDPDAAFARLERLHADHPAEVRTWLSQDPSLSALQSDPRWERLRRRDDED